MRQLKNLFSILRNTRPKLYKSLLVLLIVGVSLIVTNKLVLSVKSNDTTQNCSLENTGQCSAEELKDLYNKLEKDIQKIKESLKKLGKDKTTITKRLKILREERALLELQIQEKTLKLNILLKEEAILQDKINEIQADIDTNQAKLEVTKDSLHKYLLLNYSLQSLPWEQLLLEGKIYQFFELMGYLNYSVTEYETKINFLKLLHEHIQEQKKILNEKLDELSAKRAEAEKETKALNQSRDSLLQKENEYNQELAKLETQIKALKQQQAEINRMHNQVAVALLRFFENVSIQSGTEVKKGDVIGFIGHSGCAFGTHLHFAVKDVTTGTAFNPAPIVAGNTFRGQIVRPPIDSPIVTQGYHSGHKANDLVSGSRGIRSYCSAQNPEACYCRTKQLYLNTLCNGILSTSSIERLYENLQRFTKNSSNEACFNMYSEGAPVYAIADGKLVVRYYKGGKYIRIYHPDLNIYSYYFHLKCANGESNCID